MKKFKGYIGLFAIGFMLRINKVVHAVSAHIPKKGGAVDYNPADKQQIEGSYSLLDIIEFVNDYLWFAIGFVCFLFVVINGVKLIISRGEEKESKAAMQALIGCVIGIVVCLVAYIIVNVTIRLFD